VWRPGARARLAVRAPPGRAVVAAGSQRGPDRRLVSGDFYRRAWMPALNVVGLEGVHLHDLRHTGNQLSAEAGANLREMMERIGRDSMRAALIYLYSSPDRQRAIADQLGKNARSALGKSKRSGARTARGRGFRREISVRQAGFEPATRCLEGTSE
jgi:hypothetical protein